MEGSRPLLVEVQALVAPSELVPPRRVANGVDRNRLALVLAVLARHGGLALGSADVFVSVAGGVRVDEPGADLAIALAARLGRQGRRARRRASRTAAFGELGLTGELRHVAHADRRLAEARKFGLTRVLHPGDGAHPAPGPGASLCAAGRGEGRLARANGLEQEKALHQSQNAAQIRRYSRRIGRDAVCRG